MNRFENITEETTNHFTRLSKDSRSVAGYKPLMWFTALLLTAVVAGCGGGDPILGGGGAVAFGPGGSVPLVPLAINLRGAATFGIASSAGLTTSGITVVNGDIALYPTATCTDATGNAGASQTCLVKTYSSPTGMTVNGSIYYAGDPYDNGGTAQSIKSDLNIAWNEGMSSTMHPDTQAVGFLGGQLGGKTIIPGVYEEGSTLNLAAGTVATLDAQGDPNAVFIFKVGSSLTDSGISINPTRIDLINGALARNVWFVVALDATIGSGTIWNGNILAGQTATVNSNSMVNGRVLGGAIVGGSGAITLNNTVGLPATTINVPK